MSHLRIWITDGSLPVFSDTHRLRASHRALGILRTRYEGFVDPAVACGSATIYGDRPDDVLFVEAEWFVQFPEGIDPYRAHPEALTNSTPITLQGMIEGKWFNRLLGTREWRPASMGNNLLAQGTGIATTVRALEEGEQATIEVSYQYQRAGQSQTQVYSAVAADLRNQNVLELLRDALRVCRDLGEELDGINLGAVGELAATANERQRIRASILADSLPLPIPAPLNLFPHRAKERLVRRAMREGFSVPPGGLVTLTTRDRHAAVVGQGSLTWLQGKQAAAS